MRTVIELNRLIRRAGKQGIQVRMESLEGRRGGICWYAGRYWLFVDLALPVSEQLEQVSAALEEFENRNQPQSVKAA